MTGTTVCKICGKPTKKKSGYCSPFCQMEGRYLTYIDRWKQGLETGMKGATAISGHIRKYLMRKFDGACARCGWKEINPSTGKTPLEVEHIDGNHENNTEENLILLCPNCHSLTDTYKSLNWGHGRKHRKVIPD